MGRRIVINLVLVAGCALSSEPDADEQEPLDLADDVKQALADLSDDDKQKLRDAVVAMVGTTQLIEGDKDEEVAQLAEQDFLESDDTEWWRCDDSTRFTMDEGCGVDGCPVTLAANYKMVMGMVVFAGSESYARYDVRGLERHWNW